VDMMEINSNCRFTERDEKHDKEIITSREMKGSVDMKE
jgi:hypothetical protein